MKKMYNNIKIDGNIIHIVNYELDKIIFPEHYFMILIKKFCYKLPLLKKSPLTVIYDILIWINKILFSNR